jgi:DNA-binding NarL/FixJ family response regulator
MISMMHKTAVVIVEDDLGISESLAALINHTRNLRCAGTYPNAEAALEAIPLAAPKVALVDIQSRWHERIECVRRLKAQLPDLQVLMITAFEDTGPHLPGAQAGANGYLLKRHLTSSSSRRSRMSARAVPRCLSKSREKSSASSRVVRQGSRDGDTLPTGARCARTSRSGEDV